MGNDVREAIIHLEEDIAEAKTHIELLEQFEQPADKGLSEELNHKFCKTNLWQSNNSWRSYDLKTESEIARYVKGSVSLLTTKTMP